MRGRLVGALWYVIPLLVFSWIWLPEFSHYYHPAWRPGTDLIERMRVKPDDAVLDEIARMRWSVPVGLKSDADIILAAEHLLKRQLRLPYYPATAIAVPFAPENLAVGPVPLEIGSFIVPEILLDAYILTGREEFFAAAKEDIVAMAHYDRSWWLPRGLLWNDHALWMRIAVVSKFWRLYRGRSDFDLKTAEAVLGLLGTAGHFLAKTSHYFVRTNHGLMQNLGLLELCAAYPDIVGARNWCEIAIARQDEQLKHYVAPDGAILEHSAGYHEVGVQVLAMTLRCLTLLGRPLPPEWMEKYRNMRTYYAALRRPDGTLPSYGDTLSFASVPLVTDIDEAGRAGPLRPVPHWRPTTAFKLFPVAGQAVWWRGFDRWPDQARLSQTMMAWTHFPTYAHKHADELGVLLWSGGRTWVTSTGYWPYLRPGRWDAENWNGANGPHLRDESLTSERASELVSYGDDGRATLVDVRRRGPGGYVARRQVVQLAAGPWLVLDDIQDREPRTSVTTWTIDPAIVVSSGALAGEFRLAAPGAGPTMSAAFLHSPGAAMNRFKGSRDPFAGWVVVDREPVPAPAFMIEQPSQGSWSVAVWLPLSNDADGLVAAPQMAEWVDSEHWKLRIPLRAAELMVQRTGLELTVSAGPGARDAARLTLARGPDVSPQWNELVSRYQAASKKYPMFPNWMDYRRKITYVLIALLLVQETALLAARRWIKSRMLLVRSLFGVCWLAGGAWICLVWLSR